MEKESKNKKKVVIVEDDKLLAIVLKKMANSLDYEVLDITKTGKDAVASVKKHKPDLIFMDIVLEDDTSGIDAMKMIREYSDAPVIYITGLEDVSVRKQAAGVPNSFYMLKPVNIAELKMAMHNSDLFAA